jgi:Tol biopolymer transport system component
MSRRRIATAAVLVTACLVPPASATPPGANGLIVWQRESRSTPPRLLVANPDGSAAHRVFNFPKYAVFEGAFSPQSATATAFSRASRAPFSDDIVLGDLATGATTVIKRAKTADIAPTYSPDGLQIAYFAVPRPKQLDPDRPPPPEQIHVMNADGTADHRLTPVRRRSFDPDWAPDGARIVYSQGRIIRDGVQQRLRMMNADGTDDHALTPFGGRDELNPKWTPDGQSIVFESASPKGTRSNIVVMPAAGGGAQPILATPAWETNPIPSPDGTRIVFTSDRDRRGKERLGRGFELYTMNVDGSDIVRLTDNRIPDIFPDWQRLAP